MAVVVPLPVRDRAPCEVISLREAKAEMRRRERMAKIVDVVVRDLIRSLDDLSWMDRPADQAAFHALLSERLLRDHGALFKNDVRLSIEVST
jgi:hypothetical protein